MKTNKPAVMEPFMVKLVPAMMGTLPAFISDRVADLLRADREFRHDVLLSVLPLGQ